MPEIDHIVEDWSAEEQKALVLFVGAENRNTTFIETMSQSRHESGVENTNSK